MQYPEHFAPPTISATNPQNEDLRAATYGALTYVDWVIGDLINAFKEKKQYENTIVLVSSDNGGAIYAGTANNNFPLRGGKFNNFEGGQRVNAFFSGGWVEAALAAKSLSPFTSETVMAINDVPETLLHMVGIKHGMGHASGPLTGVALWHKILHKEQHERRIVYSETMQLIVTPNVQDLMKFWFLGKTKVISDGNWSANFPNNTEFIQILLTFTSVLVAATIATSTCQRTPPSRRALGCHLLKWMPSEESAPMHGTTMS